MTDDYSSPHTVGQGKANESLSREYIKNLEAKGLIERRIDGSIQIKHSGFISIRQNGPLQIALFQQWLPKFQKLVVSNVTQDNNYAVQIFSTFSTQESKDKFLDQFEKIKTEYLKKAEFEIKVKPDETMPFTFSIQTAPCRLEIPFKTL